MDLNTLFFRLSVKQKMIFARNLEVMVRSGMQILQSLDILKAQTKSKTFKKIIEQLNSVLIIGAVPFSKNLKKLADKAEKYINMEKIL